MKYKYIGWGLMTILLVLSAFLIGGWLKREMNYKRMCEEEAGGYYVNKDLCLNPQAIIEI